MKKLIILILIVVPFIISCEKDDKIITDDILIREIAWNSLTEKEKDSVIIDWKEAPISETSYKEKNAYAVVFSTTVDAILGPIVVYIDISSNEVLGQGLRM